MSKNCRALLVVLMGFSTTSPIQAFFTPAVGRQAEQIWLALIVGTTSCQLQNMYNDLEKINKYTQQEENNDSDDCYDEDNYYSKEENLKIMHHNLHGGILSIATLTALSVYSLSYEPRTYFYDLLKLITCANLLAGGALITRYIVQKTSNKNESQEAALLEK